MRRPATTYNAAFPFFVRDDFMKKLFLFMALVFCAIGASQAQNLAPPPAVAATAATLPPIPKPACTKPDFPGRLATDSQMRAFNKDIKAYLECMKQYATEQGAIAKSHTDAANAAIDEYNAYVKELQALKDEAAK